MIEIEKSEPKVRASSVPRILQCGPSAYIDDGIDPVNPDAILGTTVHELLAKMVNGETVTSSLIESFAAGQGFNPDTLRMMFYRGIAAWQELKKYFPFPLTEQALESELPDGTRLTGHVDVISYNAGHSTINILDWKLSDIEGKSPQLQAYAYLASNLESGIEKVNLFLVSLLSGEYEVHRFSRNELEEFAEELVEALHDVAFRPGPACKYCPGRLYCVARQTWLADGINALRKSLGQDTVAAGIKSLAERGEWERMRTFIAGLEALIRQIKAAEKEVIRDAGGQLVDGENVWTLEKRVSRRTLEVADPATTGAVVQALGSHKLLMKAVGSVSLKSIEDAAIDALKEAHQGKPPRGSIKERRQEIEQALEPYVKVSYSEIVKKAAPQLTGGNHE